MLKRNNFYVVVHERNVAVVTNKRSKYYYIPLSFFSWRERWRMMSQEMTEYIIRGLPESGTALSSINAIDEPCPIIVLWKSKLGTHCTLNIPRRRKNEN